MFKHILSYLPQYSKPSGNHLTSYLNNQHQLPEPAELAEELRTKWQIPTYYKPYLSKYYILHWSLEYYLYQISLSPKYIEHQGTKYRVVYTNSKIAANIHKLASLPANTQVYLSFRKPTQEYLGTVTPTCLVKIKLTA